MRKDRFGASRALSDRDYNQPKLFHAFLTKALRLHTLLHRLIKPIAKIQNNKEKPARGERAGSCGFDVQFGQ